MVYLRALAAVLCLTGSLLPAASVSLVVPGLIAAAGFLVLDILRTRRLPRGLGIVVVVFGALALPWLLGDPLEVLGDYGSEKLGRLFSLTLPSSIAALTLTERRHWVAFARVWVVVAAVLAFGAASGASDAAGRATGFSEANPIWLARAIATGAICAAWLVAAKHLPLWVGAAAFIVLGVGVFATGSRGPALGALVGLFIILVVAGKVWGAWLSALTAAAAYIFVYQSAAFQQSRFGSALAGDGGDENTEARLTMWRDTVDLILSRPLGVGYGNWQQSVEGDYTVAYPHNLFLEVAAEAGLVVGTVVLGATALVLIRLARRCRADRIALLLLTVVVAETLAVAVSGDVNARTFFFLLTAGWLVSTLSPGREVDSPESSAPQKIPV